MKLRELNKGNFKTFQTYQIDQAEYMKTREARMKKLVSMGFPEKEDLVPEIYEPIPSEVWQDLIVSMLKPLIKKEEELELLGLKNFAISGHTRDIKFCPWQVYTAKRYLR